MVKILLVEDDSYYRDVLCKMLEHHGYAVDTAENGREGMIRFNRNKYDIVITDIVMPEKDGFEVITEMHRIDPEVKIIAVSGGGIVSGSNYLSMAKMLQASYTFEKPIDKSALIDAVEKLTESKK